ISGRARDLAVFDIAERELGVVANKQVQQSISIIVKPGGACSPLTGISHSSLLCHLRKSSVPVVVEECASRVAGDKQVLVSVVVIIGCGHAHSVERDTIDTGFGSDFLKFPVPEIAIESVANRSWTLASGRRSPIDQV